MRLLIALAVLFAGSIPCARALDATLDASQYAHHAWRAREGFPRGGTIHAIAQTTDGYLWLGMEDGLIRFDGVRGVRWRPPPGQSLPNSYIRHLHAARDSSLWIGTLDGLARLHRGRLTTYPELAGHPINFVLEDREGTIWVTARSREAAVLCAIKATDVRCRRDSDLGEQVWSLCEDTKGRLWVASTRGLLRVLPEGIELHELPGRIPGGLQMLAAGDDGSVLVVVRNRGLMRLAEGKLEPFGAGGVADDKRIQGVLRDRDGAVWLATVIDGLIHWHEGRMDMFTHADGLSSDGVGTMFEDREGNLWVATLEGLDRFSQRAAVPLARRQGLRTAPASAVVAARDGSVWLGTGGELLRRQGSRLTTYRGDSPRGRRPSLRSSPQGQAPLPVKDLHYGAVSLYEDSAGRVWVGGDSGVGYFASERYVAVKEIPGGIVDSIAEDKAGNLWVAIRDRGLIRRSAEGAVTRTAWNALGGTDAASRLAADPRGGIWLGFREGGVSRLVDGRIVSSHGRGAGFTNGWVSTLHPEPDGTLWIGTPRGLVRLKDGRTAILNSASGLPCDFVDWVVEDGAGAFWLSTACGFVRLGPAERRAWAAAADSGDPGRARVGVALLGPSDGVRSGTFVGSYSPHGWIAPDGKLWFLASDGAIFVDPERLRPNTVPPPVHIEQIVADRKVFDLHDGTVSRSLPPLVRDLQIDYTALSFSAPDKVLFRHRLEGRDSAWVEADDRRQAFYTDLPPGDYRFRVIAANNSGVWNETGAAVAFTIPPAYYQTGWFRTLVALATLALLAGVYFLRLRHLRREFDMRTRERMGERMRIARDLHDTLLQTFQGALLKFHTAASLLPGDPLEAKRQLESVVDEAAAAIGEGREAVQGLRASTTDTNELLEDLALLGKDLAPVAPEGKAPTFHIASHGVIRDLVPLVRDEVHRITREAVRNALQHSDARRIEVQLHYERRKFRLRVRDDGAGIAEDVMATGGRQGHFGLAGMDERARLVGGTLTVRTATGLGTEITLEIAGARAYAGARRSDPKVSIATME